MKLHIQKKDYSDTFDIEFLNQHYNVSPECALIASIFVKGLNIIANEINNQTNQQNAYTDCEDEN